MEAKALIRGISDEVAKESETTNKSLGYMTQTFSINYMSQEDEPKLPLYIFPQAVYFFTAGQQQHQT